MSSGYSDNGVDFDTFFEPWQSGDPKQTPTNISVVGVDFRDRYVHVSAGSPYPQSVGCSVQGVDFSQLFAARLSVPRYPSPLPWARTDTISATIYQQPSRPALTSYVELELRIGRDGSVRVQQVTTPYNSDPSAYQTTVLRTDPANTLWPNADNADFQVRVERLTGMNPSISPAASLGSWFNISASANRFITLRYELPHSTSSGTHTSNNSFRVSVRRAQYPASNTAQATHTANFSIVIEPSVYSTSSFGGNRTVTYDDETYADTSGDDTYRSAIRLRVLTNRTAVLESAVWRNSESPSWTTIQTVTWLRNGFSVSDYEILATPSSGSLTSNPASNWVSLGSNRTFLLQNDINSNTTVGMKNQSCTFAIRIREISTKGWSGLPDNFVETTQTWNARVEVLEPPFTLFPGEHDGWAGIYTLNSSTEPFVELDSWAGYSDMTHTFQKQNSGSSQVGQSLLIRTDGARRMRFRNMVHYTNSSGNLVFVHPKEPLMPALTSYLPMTDFEWRVMRFDQSNVNTIIPSLTQGSWSSWMTFGDNPEHSQGLVGYMTRTEPVTYTTPTYVLDHKAYYRVQIRHKTITSIITEGYVYMDGTVTVT